MLTPTQVTERTKKFEELMRKGWKFAIGSSEPVFDIPNTIIKPWIEGIVLKVNEMKIITHRHNKRYQFDELSKLGDDYLSAIFDDLIKYAEAAEEDRG